MIRCQLVTLDGVKFDEEVYEVLLPTLDGDIGVLTDHMPLISVAKTGIISIRRKAGDPDDFMEQYVTYGGVIEVADNVLRVLVDEADHSDEVNEQEAQRAYELAQKMKTEAKDQVSLDHAQSLMDRQAVRLKVADMRRRRGSRPRG
ncbi:MAG TPA: ATP synthase F1 subunit epsilon [Candidatus Saccharimonadales bacterium]|nr:ATP synthase F1 subunit epsilon [Candidatus Saccharimonadales bacterium]